MPQKELIDNIKHYITRYFLITTTYIKLHEISNLDSLL